MSKREVTPCDRCGNVELNWDRDWWISDEEWLTIVPLKWRHKTLCPRCFINFAAERGLRYEVVFLRQRFFKVRRIEI